MRPPRPAGRPVGRTSAARRPIAHVQLAPGACASPVRRRRHRSARFSPPRRFSSTAIRRRLFTGFPRPDGRVRRSAPHGPGKRQSIIILREVYACKVSTGIKIVSIHDEILYRLAKFHDDSRRCRTFHVAVAVGVAISPAIVEIYPSALRRSGYILRIPLRNSPPGVEHSH